LLLTSPPPFNLVMQIPPWLWFSADQVVRATETLERIAQARQMVKETAAL
jgi:hypothetical protein